MFMGFFVAITGFGPVFGFGIDGSLLVRAAVLLYLCLCLFVWVVLCHAFAAVVA